jgi:hypothetical protein
LYIFLGLRLRNDVLQHIKTKMSSTKPTSYEPSLSTPSISAEVKGRTAGPMSVWPGLGKSSAVEGPATSEELLEGTATEGFANAQSTTSWVSGTARGWDNRDQARGLLEDGLDGAEVGQCVNVADTRVVERHEVGVGVGRLIDQRLGIVWTTGVTGCHAYRSR